MFRKFTKEQINDSLIPDFITPEQIQEIKDKFNKYCELLKEQQKENLTNINNEHSQDQHPSHQQLDETIGKQ